MGIKMDFSDVSTGDFEPLPPGNYSGVIAKVTPEQGKTSKKPYLAVQVKLHPDGETVKGNRLAFSNFSLQPQALWKLKQLLERLGWDKSDLEGEFDLDPNDLIGREVVVALGPPDPGYNNNKVNEIYGEDDVPAGQQTSGSSGF